MELIDDEKFNNEVHHVTNDYRRIMDVISTSSANQYTPVVTHSYCNLVPRRVGTHLGNIMFNEGWVARHMEDDKDISDSDEQQEIIKEMLARFYDGILNLQQEYYNFLIVDTLKTLSINGAPNVSLFHDEIHPNLKGFKKVFRKIKSVARSYDMWVD